MEGEAVTPVEPARHRWRDRRRSGAYDRYAAAAGLPVTVLECCLIPVVLVPLFVDLPRGWADTVDTVDTVFWVASTLDYLIRLELTPEPGRFVLHHLLDLALIVLWMLPVFTIPNGGRALKAVVTLRLVPLVLTAAQRARSVWRRSAGGESRTPTPEGTGT